MKDLKKLKQELLSPAKSNSTINKLYKEIYKWLEDNGYTPGTVTFDKKDSWLWVCGDDDGINFELTMIHYLITQSLGIPKKFSRRICYFAKEEVTNPHTGELIGYDLRLEINQPMNLVNIESDFPIRDLNQYYRDLKWLMEDSKKTYRDLGDLRDVIQSKTIIL